MSRFFSGDPVDKSRFFGENSLGNRTPDAQLISGIDLGDYGSLVTDRHGLVTGSPFDLEDLAAQNQAWGTQVTKALPRLIGSTALKLGQGVAMLGSAIYEAGKHELARTNPALAAQMGISTSDFNLENITDNAVVNSLFKAEEAMKESPWFKIYKSSDWDDKSIWQQIGSTAWWADEFMDGAAFALQAYVGAGVMGGARIGSLLAGSGRASQARSLSQLGRVAAGQGAKQGTMGGLSRGMKDFYSKLSRGLSPQKMGEYGDFISQVGIMTANEALFEARDMGHTIQRSLLEDAGFGEETAHMTAEEQLEFINQLPEDIKQDIKEKKGQAMQNTFIANMAAISFSNIIEVAALNKLIGKGIRKMSRSTSAQSAGRGVNLGETIEDQAQIIQRKGIQRYIGRGSRPRTIATSFGTQALSEGLYEENIQNSIANISEQFDGAANLDYLVDVFEDMIDNTFSGDKDAWKSIVTGGLLGGLMGIGSGVRQHRDNQKALNKAVDTINKAKANVVNLKGAMYQKNEDGSIKLKDGKPIPDSDALLAFAANQQKTIDLAELHDLYKVAGNIDIAEVLWNDIITDLSLSYLEAGFGEDLINQLKALGNVKENEAQENNLEETVETNEKDKTVGIQEKVNRFVEIANNVKRDYESVTSIIPNTDSNSLRINSAVRINSRLRTLNNRKQETQQNFDSLQSRLGSNPIANINTKIDRINGLQEEIKKIEKEYPKAAEKLTKQVNLLKKEVEQAKEFNRNSIQETGVDVPFGLKKIAESDNTPARIRLNKLNDRLTQFDSAIETQLEKYDDLITRPEGFRDEIVKKIINNAKKLNKETDINRELSKANPGDFVEVTYPDGTKEVLSVQTGPDGSMLLGGKKVDKDVSELYSSIRHLTPEERTEHIETVSRNFRIQQIQRRIEHIKERIKNLQERQLKQVETLRRAEDSLESLQLQKQTKQTRTSERRLDGRIRAAEELIRSTQSAIGELDALIAESNLTIEELEAIAESEEVSADNLQQEIDILKKAHAETVAERKETETFLDRLKNYYKSLQARWKKYFPDKDRVFEDFDDVADYQEGLERATSLSQGLPANMRDMIEEDVAEDTGDQDSPSAEAYRLGQEYSNFFQDMVVTAEEVAEQQRMVNALKVREAYLKERIAYLEKEQKEFEAFINQLLDPGEYNPLPGQEENSSNTPTPNGKYKEKDVPSDGEPFDPRKNIAHGLFTTTGNSKSISDIMKRWFKFTETVSLGMNQSLFLMPVTIHHPLYGVGKKYDLYKGEPAEYRTIDNIKVVPVEAFDATAEGGFRPHRIDGEIVNTSLIEISRNGKETFESFTFKSGDVAGTPMFHNKDGLTNKQIDKIIDDYRKLINSIKDRAEKGKSPKVIAANSKSWGYIRSDGINRNAQTAFGFIPQLEVSTKSDVRQMNTTYDVEVGMGYVYYKGRPIPAETRKINREEATGILKLLKTLSKDPNKGNSKNATLQRLKTIVFMGKSSNPEFSTFFARGNKGFIFGDTTITLSDLESGKYDVEIIDHLTTLNHQINLKQLKSEDSYTSVLGETYPSYNDYLLNPATNNRQDAFVPVKFDIIAPSNGIDTRQVDGIYLSFSDTTKKSKPKKKAQTKASPAQKEGENRFGLSYSTESSIVAEAEKQGKKDGITPEQAAALKAEETNQRNQERLENITNQARVITVSNGESYVIDRGQKAIFHSESGTLVTSKDLREEILGIEKEEYGEQASATEETTEQQEETTAEEFTPTEETTKPSLQDILKKQVDNPLEEFDDFTEDTSNEAGENNVKERTEEDEYDDFGFRPVSKEEANALQSELKAEQKKEAKRAIHKETKNNKDAPFLLQSTVTNYKQANVEQEIAELERLVGSKALAGIVHGLIQNKAFGLTLQDGRILLSDLMTEGTSYHEAFHRIFEGIISPSEVRQIIQEWRQTNKYNVSTPLKVTKKEFNPDLAPDGYSRNIRLNGTLIGHFALIDYNDEVHLTGSLGARTEIFEEFRSQGYGYLAYLELAKQVKSENKVLVSDSQLSKEAKNLWEKLVSNGYAIKETKEGIETYKIDNESLEGLTQLSDYQVIEELAEEFRDYMLTNNQPDGLLGRAFNWIKNFLRSILGIPASARDRLFYKIKQGDFKDATVKRQIRPDAFLEVGGTLLRNEFGSVTEREVMDGLSFTFLQNLIDNNFDIDDILNFNAGVLEESDNDRIANIYNDSLVSVIQTIHKAKKHFPNPVTEELLETLVNQSQFGTRSRLFYDFSNHLQRYSITLNEEQANEPLSEDEKSKDTLGIISSIEFNVKSGVPNTIKLVLASLPSLNRQGRLNRNSLGLPQLSNYKRNLAILHNQLASLESVEEMRDKIVELSDTYPEYGTLLKRLGIPIAGDVISDSTPTNVVRLQNQFRQQFDKANKTYFIQVYDETGNSYFLDANSERASDLTKQRWAANFRMLPKTNITSINGRYVFNTKFFDKFKGKLRDNSDILFFYKAMGIEFSNPDALTEENYNKLRTLSKHFLDVIDRGDVETLFDAELNITGRINELVEIELEHSIDFTDNQHINAEGKTVYGVTLNTYLDIAIRKINKAIPDFLKWDKKSNTGVVSARNSVFLNGPFKLRLDILGGSKVIEGDISDQGIGTDKLSRSESSVQQFTSIMNGIFPFMRQGDRKIEYAITLLNKTGSRASVNSLNIDTIQEVQEIFKGYLADELLSSWMLNVEGVGEDIPTYKEVTKDLRVFKGIFNSSLTRQYKAIITNSDKTRPEIIKTIDAFVNRDTVKNAITSYIEGKTKQYLNEFVKNGTLTKVEDGYVNHGLPKEIIGDDTTLSAPEMEKHIERFTVLSLIGNIEQQKLFTGDFAFYKKQGNVHDFFKRTSGLGGTGKTLRNDSQFNNWLQRNMPRQDRDINGKIDSWVFDNVMAKSSLHKNYVESLIERGFTKEQAEELLEPYTRYDEADAQGYITLPEYRELLFRAGDWNTSQELVYQKIMSEERLTSKDILTFPPLKPQYFGPQDYNGLYVPTFYKLSLMPLIPGVITENSPLGQLNRDMLSNGVGITTFTSGNKVGKLDGQPFYNSNGSYNTEAKQLQVLDYDFMKIQLDMTPEKHHKVTFGTQFRKLVLSNLVGKKLYNKEGTEYIKEYTDLIKQQIELERDFIFDKLGIKLGETKATINRNKLSNILKDEAFKRAAPNNVIDDLSVVLASSRNAEIMVTRGKMESIMLSLINNTMIHNKVFGDMMVQASSTGYEGRNRTKLQKDIEDEPWASDLQNLKFYEDSKTGTTAMEVYVPHRFKELYGKDVNINNIDSRLLDLIGFRIPTQGLNSIEVIRIKGFLPQEAGNTVIVPSEIVAKAGSDFDIDKLTLFMPNYRVKYSNRIKTDALARFPELAREGAYSRLMGSKRTSRFIDNIRTYEELDYSGNQLDAEEKRLLELYREFRRESTDSYIEALEYIEYDTNNPTREGIQNEIIRLSREIVSAPENFKDLIAPISSALIKKEAEYLEKLKPSLIEEKDRGNYIDFDYIMTVREDFLTGEGGVGIAASNLAHHILSQIAGLGIMKGDKTWLNLNHNGVSDYIDLAGVRDSQNEDNVQAASIADIISAFLNGFVDIAKDPFLRIINASTDTAGTFFYLLRAGVPLRQTVLFMNQPIIIDYLNNLKLGQSMARKSRGESKSRKDIEAETRGNFPTSDRYDFSDTKEREAYLKLLDDTNLAKAIRGKLPEVEFNRMQDQILTDYLEYTRVAGKLLKLHQATNADTRGTGPSMFSASDLLDRFKEIKEEGFFEGVENFETETIIGIFNDAVDASVKAYQPLFPYLQREAFKRVQRRIINIARQNPYVSQANINKLASTIENDFISYMFQHSRTGGVKRGSLISKYFSGDNSLPKQIARIKESNDPIKNNLLIQELYPILSSSNTSREKGKDFDNLKFFSRRIIKEHADDISNAWEELFALQPELASRIFNLAVLQSSFNNSPIEFLKHAPAKYSSEILRQAINIDANSQELDMLDFEEKFYQNNMFNGDLVPFTRSGSMGIYGYVSNIKGNILSARKGTETYPYVRTSVKKYPRDKASKEKIHMLFRNTGEKSSNGYPLFERVNVMGNGYFFKEYVGEQSAIAENNISIQQNRTITVDSITEAKQILKTEIVSNTELTKTQKGEYIRLANIAETIEQIAGIREQICK